MGVVVTDGAVDFTQQRYVSNSVTLTAQACNYIGELFAHSGWAGGLAVGARQHCYIGKFMRLLGELGDYGVAFCQEQFAAFTQH